MPFTAKRGFSYKRPASGLEVTLSSGSWTSDACFLHISESLTPPAGTKLLQIPYIHGYAWVTIFATSKNKCKTSPAAVPEASPRAETPRPLSEQLREVSRHGSRWCSGSARPEKQRLDLRTTSIRQSLHARSNRVPEIMHL